MCQVKCGGVCSHGQARGELDEGNGSIGQQAMTDGGMCGSRWVYMGWAHRVIE